MNALKPRPPFQVLMMSEESRLGREAIETAYALKQIIRLASACFSTSRTASGRSTPRPRKSCCRSPRSRMNSSGRRGASARTMRCCARQRPGTSPAAACSGTERRDPRADGRRSHVERRINEAEAAIVRQVFQLSADGYGVKAIAKRLNAEARRRRGRSRDARRPGRHRRYEKCFIGSVPRRHRLEPDPQAGHLGPAPSGGAARR